MNILRHLDHVRPDALSAEQRAAWREYILESLEESRLERRAAQMWSEAIDAGDFQRAQEIASWFE